ncbi:integrase domain-containing protein [Vibrio alfacsensis]|uniref:integrase domain-containing protein n=1 Tax=Vibrio alfacsensis TaxID=1074311 RepID=UPI00406963BD
MRKTQYIGHLTRGARDFSKPNFALGSKDMRKALINASFENQGGVVSNTHRARLPAIKLFVEYVKTNFAIKRLNEIDRYHVMSFGQALKNNVETGVFSSSTARDYLSHINRSLAQARGDEHCVVNATKDLGFIPKSGIAREDASVPEALHKYVLQYVTEELRLIMQLQRTFGFRFKEAALFDATQALKELDKGNTPILSRGTKGGQPRSFFVDTHQKHQLLLLVSNHQKSLGQITLIPSSLSFKAFQCHAWRQTQKAAPEYRSHGERKHFACETYFSLMGVRCPVQANIAHGQAHHQYIAKQLAISVQEARVLDKEVRLILSELLGHHRVSITNAYIG